MRDNLYRDLKEKFPKIKLNGHIENRLAHNLNLTIPGVEVKALAHCLKDKLAFSGGSACSTINVEPSHVLKAIGLTDEETYQSIRLGFGRFVDEWSSIKEIFEKAIKQLLQT